MYFFFFKWDGLDSMMSTFFYFIFLKLQTKLKCSTAELKCYNLDVVNLSLRNGKRKVFFFCLFFKQKKVNCCIFSFMEPRHHCTWLVSALWLLISHVAGFIFFIWIYFLMGTYLTSNVLKTTFILMFLVISCHLLFCLASFCFTHCTFVQISMYLPVFYFCIDYVTMFRWVDFS